MSLSEKIIYSFVVFLVLTSLGYAARQAAVGGDLNDWGTQNNLYLNVSHNETGHLRIGLNATFNRVDVNSINGTPVSSFLTSFTESDPYFASLRSSLINLSMLDNGTLIRLGNLSNLRVNYSNWASNASNSTWSSNTSGVNCININGGSDTDYCTDATGGAGLSYGFNASAYNLNVTNTLGVGTGEGNIAMNASGNKLYVNGSIEIQNYTKTSNLNVTSGAWLSYLTGMTCIGTDTTGKITMGTCGSSSSDPSNATDINKYNTTWIAANEVDPQVGAVNYPTYICEADGDSVECDLIQDGTGDCGASNVCIGGHTHSEYEPVTSVGTDFATNIKNYFTSNLTLPTTTTANYITNITSYLGGVGANYSLIRAGNISWVGYATNLSLKNFVIETNTSMKSYVDLSDDMFNGTTQTYVNPYTYTPVVLINGTTGVNGSLGIFNGTGADSTNWLQYFNGTKSWLRDVTVYTTLTLSQLTNQNCLGTDTNGQVQAGSCGAGSLADSTYYALNISSYLPNSSIALIANNSLLNRIVEQNTTMKSYVDATFITSVPPMPTNATIQIGSGQITETSGWQNTSNAWNEGNFSTQLNLHLNGSNINHSNINVYSLNGSALSLFNTSVSMNNYYIMSIINTMLNQNFTVYNTTITAFIRANNPTNSTIQINSNQVADLGTQFTNNLSVYIKNNTNANFSAVNIFKSLNTTNLTASITKLDNLSVSGNMYTALNFSVDDGLFYNSLTNHLSVGTATTTATEELAVTGNASVSLNLTVNGMTMGKYNSTCGFFRFGTTGGLWLSCTP